MDNPQDKINKLLSDPDNLKTIAKIASSLMDSQSLQTNSDGDNSLQSKQSNTESTQESNTSVETSDSSQGLLYGALGDFLQKADFDKSIGLINAIKPYLSNHKKETCEMLLKILGAAKLFGMYKG